MPRVESLCHSNIKFSGGGGIQVEKWHPHSNLVEKYQEGNLGGNIASLSLYILSWDGYSIGIWKEAKPGAWKHLKWEVAKQKWVSQNYKKMIIWVERDSVYSKERKEERAYLKNSYLNNWTKKNESKKGMTVFPWK